MKTSLALFLIIAAASGALGSRKSRRPQNVECPPPYVDIYGSCVYVDIFERGTWHDMSFLCEGLDGHLLKLDNLELYYSLINYIKDKGLSAHDFWIGGTDAAFEGQWVWPDGTGVRMGTPFWSSYGYESDAIQLPDGGYNENCLLLNQNLFHFFDDSSCLDIYNVICQKVM